MPGSREMILPTTEATLRGTTKGNCCLRERRESFNLQTRLGGIEIRLADKSQCKPSHSRDYRRGETGLGELTTTPALAKSFFTIFDARPAWSRVGRQTIPSSKYKTG